MTLRCCAILCTTVGTTWLVTTASGQSVERAEEWAPAEEQLVAPFREEHLASLDETVVPVWVDWRYALADSPRLEGIAPKQVHYADELLLVRRPELTQWPSTERIRSHQPYDRVEAIRPDLKADLRVAEPGHFANRATRETWGFVRADLNEPWRAGPEPDTVRMVPIQAEDPYESHVLYRTSTPRGDLMVAKHTSQTVLVVRLVPELCEGVAPEDLGALAAQEALRNPTSFTDYEFEEIWSADGLHLFSRSDAFTFDYHHALQVTHWYTDGRSVAILRQHIIEDPGGEREKPGRPWF